VLGDTTNNARVYVNAPNQFSGVNFIERFGQSADPAPSQGFQTNRGNGTLGPLTIVLPPELLMNVTSLKDTTATGQVLDINGDAIQDVAVLDTLNSQMHLLVNAGTGLRFTEALNSNPGVGVNAPIDIGPARQPESFALGDLDDDVSDDLDIAVGNRNDNSITFIENLGGGAYRTNSQFFLAGIIPPATALLDDIAIGQLDGQIGDDIVVAFNSSSTAFASDIGILLNTSGFFFSQDYVAAGTNTAGTNAVALGDFDNANGLDIAVSNFNSSNIVLRLNDGVGGFGGAPTIVTGLGAPRALAVGNFDGNTSLDLAAHSDTQFATFLGNGAGGLSFNQTFTTSTVAFSGFAVGQINNDLADDAVVANDGRVSVLLNAPDQLGGTGGSPVTGGSTNAVIRRGIQAGPGFPTNGEGIGAFGSPILVVLPLGVTSLTSLDADGDGDVDLAGISFSADYAAVFLNTGSGTAFTLGTGSPYNLGTGKRPIKIVAADIDGDGLADLAIGNSGDRTLSTLGSNGDGSFSGPFTVTPANATSSGTPPTPATLSDIVAGDLNGDGDADLVVTYNHSDAAFSNDIHLFIHSGGPTDVVTFTQPQPLPAGTNTNSVTLGHFNDDDGDRTYGSAGDYLDIAAANFGSSDITVYLSTSNAATYQQALNSPIALSSSLPNSRPVRIVAADLNSDGSDDLAFTSLAVAGGGFNGVVPLLSLGDGRFLFNVTGSGRPSVSAGLGGLLIATRLNNDLADDLVVTDSTAANVFIDVGQQIDGSAFVLRYGVPIAAGPYAGQASGGFSPATLITRPQADLLLTGAEALLPGQLNPTGVAALPGATGLRGMDDFDVDGDGSLDFVGVFQGTNTVVVFRSDGAGDFIKGAVNVLDPMDMPTSVAAVELDTPVSASGTRPDIAVADFGTGRVSFLQNTFGGLTDFLFAARVAVGTIPVQQPGQPPPAPPTPGVGTPFDIVAADFDNDDWVDVATANFSTDANFADDVTALSNPNDGTLNFFRAFSSAGNGNLTAQAATIAITSGDFNRDGRPDLAVANRDSSTVSVFLFTPATQVFGGAQNAAAGANPQDLAVGDFNNDYNPDIAVSGPNATQEIITLLLNDPAHTGGPGTIFSAVTINAAPGGGNEEPIPLAVGRFDNNQSDDLAVGNFNHNTVAVFLGATQSFGSSGGLGRDPVLYPDPAFRVLGGAGGDAINTGKGGSGSAVNFINLTSNLPATTFFDGPRPMASVFGNFDPGGTLDLAVVDAGTDSVTILSGNGGGTFTSIAQYRVGAEPRDLVAVGAYLATANAADNTVTILSRFVTGLSFTSPTSNSSRPYLASTTIPVGTRPVALASADFDGDGSSDLAVVNSGGNTVTILMQAGAVIDPKTGDVMPVFTTASTVAVGSLPGDIIAADFNGDALPDLAVTNAGSDTVTILRNTGGGAFTRVDQDPTTGGVQDLPVGRNPTSVTAVAAGGSAGDLDLAVTNGADGTVSVMVNDGAAVFGQVLPFGSAEAAGALGNGADDDSDGVIDDGGRQDYWVGIDPVHVINFAAPGGANGPGAAADGPNLAVVCEASDSVAILRPALASTGTGAGTMPPSSQSLYANPFFISLAARSGPIFINKGLIDGNNTTDFVVSNFTGNSVTAIMNPAVPPTTQPAGVITNPFTVPTHNKVILETPDGGDSLAASGTGGNSGGINRVALNTTASGLSVELIGGDGGVGGRQAGNAGDVEPGVGMSGIFNQPLPPPPPPFNILGAGKVEIPPIPDGTIIKGDPLPSPTPYVPPPPPPPNFPLGIFSGAELIVRAGDGGDGNAAVANSNPGNGGFVRNVILAANGDEFGNAPFVSSLNARWGDIMVVAGDGGTPGATGGRGTGNGGSIVNVGITLTTYVAGSTTPSVIPRHVEYDAGDGASGLTGGNGGSIVTQHARLAPFSLTLSTFAASQVTAIDRLLLVAGNGGNATSGRAGSGGNISSYWGVVNPNPALLPVDPSNISVLSPTYLGTGFVPNVDVGLYGGNGGTNINNTGDGGNGGRVDNFVERNLSGWMRMDGGDGGNGRRGGSGGGVKGMFFQASETLSPVEVYLTAGNGGAGTSSPGGAGGSVETAYGDTQGSFFAAVAGNGGNSTLSYGGNGGAVRDIETAATTNNVFLLGGNGGDGRLGGGSGGGLSLLDVNAAGRVELDAGNGGAATVGRGGAGGDINGVNQPSNVLMFFSDSTAGTGGITAGAGGAGAGGGGRGGNVTNITVVGTIDVIQAGDGGNATGIRTRGGDGGSVTNIRQLQDGSNIRSIIGGDGGSNTTATGGTGGLGGSIRNVITGGDIGVFPIGPYPMPATYGPSDLGGLFAGTGGANSTAAVAGDNPLTNGSVLDITADRIATIVAGTGTGTGTGAAKAVNLLDRVVASILGRDLDGDTLFDFTAFGGIHPLFDQNPAGTLVLRDAPIDGVVMARVIGSSIKTNPGLFFAFETSTLTYYGTFTGQSPV
jgi:hypothetical protein